MKMHRSGGGACCVFATNPLLVAETRCLHCLRPKASGTRRMAIVVFVFWSFDISFATDVRVFCIVLESTIAFGFVGPIKLFLLLRLVLWFGHEHALKHEPCFKTRISTRGAEHIHARVENMQKALLAERTQSPN